MKPSLDTLEDVRHFLRDLALQAVTAAFLLVLVNFVRMLGAQL